MTAPEERTSVLVVGGSLVGLSAAVFLRAHGVPTVLVEPYLGSHPHPRAIGYTPRTMELFRSVGLGDAIPEAPPGFRLRRRRIESLAGRWLDETAWTPDKPERPAGGGGDESPVRGAAIAQDRLEPILREKARVTGADLRLGTRLVRFAQDDAGVTAWLAERDGGEYTLRAEYLVAADGNQSAVREALGIGRNGRGHIRTLRSVLFRAPLDEYLASGMHQFEIEQPGFEAFLTTYNDGRWVLMFSDDRERDGAELRAAVQRAIGRSDVPVELIATGRWELSALVAERFSAARVFLAGDAAHTLPPTRGGFGANTGIQDAHNLAWKLAAVLAGTSRPALLDTYDEERRPVAWERLLQTFARPDYAAYASGIADGVPIRDDAALEFGQLYRSAAVLGAGPDLPPAARPDGWRGQPGTRAPHVAVTRTGERISTLDFVGRDWVLLTTDAAWRPAAAAATARLGVAVRTVCLGQDFEAEGATLQDAFGIGARGASLVRPDGYVAWRVAESSEDRADALTEALHNAAQASPRA